MLRPTCFSIALSLAVIPAVQADEPPLVERFDDPLDLTRAWLSEVSDIKNYYGPPTERGNNPTGLWISMEVPRPDEVAISFVPSFGDNVATLSVDAACWTTESVFFALDMEGETIFTAPCTINENTPVMEYPHQFVVESENGISKWGFRGPSLYGNTAIDNVAVTFRSAGE